MRQKEFFLNPFDFSFDYRDVQTTTEAVRIENERICQCLQLVTTLVRVLDSDGNLLKEVYPKDFGSYGIDKCIGKS